MKRTNTKTARKLTAYELTYVALAAALLSICAWISIPAGDIPVTLQTFAVFVIAGLLGTKLSLLAITVYLLMGAVGLPVFSGMMGGLGRLAGPTGGYLIGFIFTALIVGSITRHFGKKPFTLALSMISGMAVCYAFGTIWYVLISMGSLHLAGIGAALAKCVVPYLIPDGVKITAAVWVVRKLAPFSSPQYAS